MKIKLTRIPPKIFKVSENEFNITRMFLDAFDIDCENDYSLTYNYLSLTCGDKLLAYTERYNQLKNIPTNMMIFRPLKNEKHANTIIDMFDDLNLIESDNIEIREFSKNGKKKYSGYLKHGNKIIEESIIKSSPTIPILKTSVIAKTLFDEETYDEYRHNLYGFLTNNKSHKPRRWW